MIFCDKCIFKIAFISLLLIFTFGTIQTEEVSIEEKQQITLVAKIIENSTSKEMEQVWPGLNLKESPLIITLENGHIYAFNLESNDPQFSKINSTFGTFLYSSEDHWGLMNSPMQFDFEIENQKAFVFRLDMMQENIFIPFFVMVHERFHVYQIKHFASEKDIGEEEYPDSDNLDNLSLMQMEELILLDFLKSLTRGSKEDFYFYLKSYISVNKVRRKLLKQTSIAWENRQQMVEGLADYVGAKNLDTFEYFGQKVGQRHLLQTMYGYTKNENITERALKWRHYGVGASLAFALDYLKVEGWKEAIEKNISLQEQLESNIPLNSKEVATYFHLASIKYDLELLKLRVEEKTAAYNKMINSHIMQFNNQKGIIINLHSPKHLGLCTGGYSKGVYSLADGGMLSVDDTSKSASPDNAWTLELQSIPQLFQTKDRYRRFKENTESLQIVLDGKKHFLQELSDDKEFMQISVKGKSSSFQSSAYKGRVKVVDNELTILFE